MISFFELDVKYTAHLRKSFLDPSVWKASRPSLAFGRLVCAMGAFATHSPLDGPLGPRVKAELSAADSLVLS